MNIKNKKIGIWGFGIVGKSAARFLTSHGAQLTVMDSKVLSEEDQMFCVYHKITVMRQDAIETFLQEHKYVLVSPGIDLRPINAHQHKFITELDLFAAYFNKSIIAITGTVGKTTLTHALAEMLKQHGYHVATGGNIGTGMLDLIDQQENLDYAIIEASSFQLTYTKKFAPNLAR